MCEKFNSGMGGYICDHCRVLLWAGRDGADHPEKRRYIYSATVETVVEKDGLWFCSAECSTNYRDDETAERRLSSDGSEQVLGSIARPSEAGTGPR